VAAAVIKNTRGQNTAGKASLSWRIKAGIMCYEFLRQRRISPAGRPPPQRGRQALADYSANMCSIYT